MSVPGNQGTILQPGGYVPLPPPASFPLPPSSSVVLPSTTGKGHVKRTARWSWEENSEWEVIVHKEGDQNTSKFRPPPLKAPPKTPSQLVSPSDTGEGKGSNILAKNTGKPKPGSPTKVSSGHSGEKDSDPAQSLDQGYTDPEGWIYGDNKWENASAKGGIGKVRCSY